MRGWTSTKSKIKMGKERDLQISYVVSWNKDKIRNSQQTKEHKGKAIITCTDSSGYFVNPIFEIQ